MPRGSGTAGPRAARRLRPRPTSRARPQPSDSVPPAPTRGTAVHVAPAAGSRRFPSVPREDTLGTAAAVPPCWLSRIKILLPLAEPSLLLFAPQENYSAFNCWGAKCCWPSPAGGRAQMSGCAGSPGRGGPAPWGGAAQGDPGRHFAVYGVYGSRLSHDSQPLPETGQEGQFAGRW